LIFIIPGRIRNPVKCWLFLNTKSCHDFYLNAYRISRYYLMRITRPSHFAFLALLGAASIFAATFADAFWLRTQRANAMVQKLDLVTRLQLTDLCLFTEARYTRHLSQADLHSAAQDHPLGLEHFPTGSLVAPPAHLTGERDFGTGQQD
jgi:hypothetical protein